jgi:hypothetical protein
LPTTRHNTEIFIIRFHQNIAAAQMDFVGANLTTYHQIVKKRTTVGFRTSTQPTKREYYLQVWDNVR